MSPLAGTKHTYVRLAIIVYCQILAPFFQVCEWHITQLGILMWYKARLPPSFWCERDFKRDVCRVSRKVSDESLGRDETYVCKASHNCLLSNSCTFFQNCGLFQYFRRNQRSLACFKGAWKENSYPQGTMAHNDSRGYNRTGESPRG